MRTREPTRFRFPHFTRTNPLPDIAPTQTKHSAFLHAQLTAANRENSTLRQALTHARDAHARTVHTLRQQKSSLEARVSALSDENAALATDVRCVREQSSRAVFEATSVRAEAESLKRRLRDADRRTAIVKRALRELTQELAEVTKRGDCVAQELLVVKRERETALDDICNMQNLMQRERCQHEARENALRKKVMDIRKESSIFSKATTSKSTPDLARTPRVGEGRADGMSDVDNPFVTDSLSTEILTPRPQSEYHVLFNPQIPMTPIRAMDESDYVVKGHGFDSILESAFATVDTGKARLDFDMVLNEPFSAWGSAERPTMMYIGFEYPDGTSLCYAPLRDVRVKHSSSRDSPESPSKSHVLGADYGRDYVQLSIREEVYHALVARAKSVFATRYGGERVELPRVSYEKWTQGKGDAVAITASMKPDARVERVVESEKLKPLLSNELLSRREDIVGDALLAMRFSKAYPNEAGYMLGFKLHGMFVGPR